METFRILPAIPVQVVDQVKVEIVRLAPGELLVPDALHIRLFFQSADRHLAYEIVTVPRISGEQVPCTFFAESVMVKVGGVKVIDSAAIARAICFSAVA